MTDEKQRVVAGVDAHTDEHHVAVLDAQGRLLGTAAFPTTADGYARLVGWVRGHGTIDQIGGVESAHRCASATRRPDHHRAATATQRAAAWAHTARASCSLSEAPTQHQDAAPAGTSCQARSPPPRSTDPRP